MSLRDTLATAITTFNASPTLANDYARQSAAAAVASADADFLAGRVTSSTDPLHVLQFARQLRAMCLLQPINAEGVPTYITLSSPTMTLIQSFTNDLRGARLNGDVINLDVGADIDGAALQHLLTDYWANLLINAQQPVLCQRHLQVPGSALLSENPWTSPVNINGIGLNVIQQLRNLGIYSGNVATYNYPIQ
jgi:hypothetical protein